MKTPIKFGFLIAAAALLSGCGGGGAPGEHDEFYEFFSGGFSGQVSVVGLPSGRLFRRIPVFSVDAEKGYGFDEETKAMLNTSHGFVPWDDSHHPKLSQTEGAIDGRWLFINGNNTPRIARIDLTTFETAEIIEIPNSAGNHSSPYLTQNSEYVVAGTRFSMPWSSSLNFNQRCKASISSVLVLVYPLFTEGVPITNLLAKRLYNPSVSIME